MVQTASDLFEQEIRLISPKNDTFQPFIRLKNFPKSFGIVQLMVKQRLRFCFALVCNSTENTGVFLILQVLLCIPVEIQPKFIKIHKMTLLAEKNFKMSI